MTTVKQGHTAIASSVRPEEITLLRELTDHVNEVRLRRQWPGPSVQRAGVIRGAVRYVLEHRHEFLEWLDSEYRTRFGPENGRRDAE